MRIRLLLAGIAVLVLGAVAWLAVVTIDSQYEREVERALRSMDRKLDVILAPERRRPATDYSSYAYLTGDAYSRSFKKLKADQVRIPSPLLTRKPEHTQLHFQIVDQAFTSPQVPVGNDRELATDVEKKVTPDQLAADSRQLQHIAALVVPQELKDVATPKLSGLWQGGELIFVRTAEDKLQGFWADWPGLRKTLLDEIADVFSDATLEPGSDTKRQLIAIPAVLHAPRHWTVIHTWLAIVALLVILAVAVVGWQLHTRIEQQRRFASHVTHELRGPLTTFRLYHELLDEGMVDAGKQREYFATLRSESDRMAHLVENVIALSRLESGRARFRMQATTMSALMERAEPILRRIAPALVVESKRDATIQVDDEAVCQILTNLVENAVKYGEAPITLTVDGPRFVVEDAGGGPGAAPFKPYERGRHEGTATRGLGLGLPLSRMLAREMGGDLTHEPPATFVVRLRSP